MSIVITGGGICGLGTALLLARDGHHVTVCELRLLLEKELPDVNDALRDAGAARYDFHNPCRRL